MDAYIPIDCKFGCVGRAVTLQSFVPLTSVGSLCWDLSTTLLSTYLSLPLASECFVCFMYWRHTRSFITLWRTNASWSCCRWLRTRRTTRWSTPLKASQSLRDRLPHLYLLLDPGNGSALIWVSHACQRSVGVHQNCTLRDVQGWGWLRGRRHSLYSQLGRATFGCLDGWLSLKHRYSWTTGISVKN